MLVLLLNARSRRRALRQHRQAAAGPGVNGFTWSILFIIIIFFAIIGGLIVLVEYVGA